MAHANHMRQAGSWYWSQYIAYIMNYSLSGSTYGWASSKNSGICGVGEMWGFNVGGYLATQEYNAGGKFDLHDYRENWFKQEIIASLLVGSVGLTHKQIYDCLTEDVRSHEQLKNKLILKYGNEAAIKKVFSNNGF